MGKMSTGTEWQTCHTSPRVIPDTTFRSSYSGRLYHLEPPGVAVRTGLHSAAPNAHAPATKGAEMRMILVAGLLAVASVVMNPSPPSGQGEPEKTLQDASATRLKSMTSGRRRGVGQVHHRRFHCDRSRRWREDQGTADDGDQGRRPRPPVRTRHSQIRSGGWYGPNLISTQQTPVDGKPTWITTVWVKQQGAWKVATVQMTNIAK